MDFVKTQLQEENIPFISTLHTASLYTLMYSTVKTYQIILANY